MPALHHEVRGEGDPVVLVHGSWADGRHWLRLTAELEDSFAVLVYDRRGHGRSGGSRGGVGEHVRDLAALLEQVAAGAARVVGGSYGGSVALRLAAERPDLVANVCVHEPPLSGLLSGTAGPRPPEKMPGAQEFAESSLGQGAWERLSELERAAFRDNGSAWCDEMADAGAFSIERDALAAVDRPLLISLGGASPPFFSQVARALCEIAPAVALVRTIEGAGHLPHLTHPREYAALLRSFAIAAGAPR